MIDVRKLAAVDIVFLGSRIILAEFSLGVFGPFALGVFTLLRSHSLGGIALGAYLLFIAVNYVPLLLHAISLVRRDSARCEIAEEITDKRRMFRKYRSQSLLLLVPLAVPILALARESHRDNQTGYPSSFQRENLLQRHSVLALRGHPNPAM